LRGRRLTAPSSFHNRPERAALYQGPLPHSSICPKTEGRSEGPTIIPLRGPDASVYNSPDPIPP